MNITPWQVQRANREALALGLQSKITFLEADYCRTGLPDASFDALVGIESVVHAQDKLSFADEAFRLLKPGGKLIIAEYLLRAEPLSTVQQKLLQIWLDGWAMPSLLSDNAYNDLLSRAGFSNTQILDWTDQVMPSFFRLKRIAKFLTPIALTLLRFKLINGGQYQNLMACNAQLVALRLGLWRYKVVVAEKP